MKLQASDLFKKQYIAVFIDGPAKGTEMAIPHPVPLWKMATIPDIATLGEMAATPSLTAISVVYERIGHFAPCGRGQFRLRE